MNWHPWRMGIQYSENGWYAISKYQLADGNQMFYVRRTRSHPQGPHIIRGSIATDDLAREICEADHTSLGDDP